MGDKPDMTLSVSVAVTGSIDGTGTVTATAAYAQTASNPQSSNVVGANGDIDLKNMAFDRKHFSKDTDITFNLSGQITDANGGSVGFSFPSTVTDAVTITKQGGGNSEKLTPSIGTSQQQLIIDDEDNDGASYNYCLAILVATQPNGTLTQLDPRIVNR